MPITMQGKWTVSVHGKNAAFAQRFTITRSDGSKKTYDGKVSLPSVEVDDHAWTIAIEHKPSGANAAWKPSDERIQPPTQSGNQVQFNIESNDSGSDQDYDDLVLQCTKQLGPWDYVVFGKVRCYQGPCYFNPCFPYVVVDTLEHLTAVASNPLFRKVAQRLYPTQVRQLDKGRLSAENFRPIEIQWSAPDDSASSATARLSAEASPRVAAGLERSEIHGLASLLGKYQLFCQHQPAAGTLLRFQEYDRTPSELVGGPYSGDGKRDKLGHAVTDANGNYLFCFRFPKSFGQLIDEAKDGVPFNPNLRPDVLVQAVGSLPSGGFGTLYETAPYYNVSQVRRINICIPKSKLNPGPKCQGDHIIQSIGNIWTILPTINQFDAEGRVTATHSQGPKTRAAGWHGTLDLFACLDDPKIAYYTLSYRNAAQPWTDIAQNYTHPRYDELSMPGYEGSKVGPFYDRGNDLATRPYYRNIETDPAWIPTHRQRKIQLNSGACEVGAAVANRTVELKIVGYDAVGKKIAQATDQIKLFIDNRAVNGEIDKLTLGSQDPGECGKFKLSSDAAPIQVRFRANQPGGQLAGYSLQVLRGSNTSVPVHDTVDARRAAWSFDPAAHDALFFGSANLASSDGDGFVTAELTPTSSWLGSFQSCAFAFELHGSGRRTNGYSNEAGRRHDLELVCIEK